MSDSASRLPTPHRRYEGVGGTEPGDRETTLFDGQGVLITSERVVADGCSWPLGDVEAVDSIRLGPRFFPWLVTLVVGTVVGLPALLSVMATPAAQGRGLYNAALAFAGLAIFGSIAALLVMGDTYWLVLRTQQSEGRVLRSRDPQLISNLVTVVTQAAQAARQRH